jgi:hypothetical protein
MVDKRGHAQIDSLNLAQERIVRVAIQLIQPSIAPDQRVKVWAIG